MVSRLLAAALAGFCSLTISREGEGPRARLGVKVVVDPFPLIEAAAHELAGAPPEVGAEPDVGAWTAFATGFARLAERLNWQQPWPPVPSVPPLTVVETAFVPGSTPRLDITFSEPLNASTVDVGSFAFAAPITVAFVTVDLGSAVAQVSLNGTTSANPGTQPVTIAGVEGVNGERLNPDPQQVAWILP